MGAVLLLSEAIVVISQRYVAPVPVPPVASSGARGLHLPGGINLGGLPASSPAVSKMGIIYVESSQGQDGKTFLHAFGEWPKLLWKIPVGKGRFINPPAVGPDGVVCVSSSDGTLTAFGTDGHKKWAYKTGGRLYDNPAIRPDGILYVGADDGYLYAIKPNGKLDWKYKIGGRLQGELAFDPVGTIYAGTPDDSLLSLTPNGDFEWKLNLGATVRGTPAVSDKDLTIYLIASDDKLYAVTADGSIKWKLPVRETSTGSPISDGENVMYMAAETQTLYSIDAAGKLFRTWDTNSQDAPLEARLLLGSTGIYGRPTLFYLSKYAVDVTGSFYKLTYGVH